ncbi:MAG TPA: hypothetical protein VIR65_02510 [Rhizorhapis sp.]
MSEDMIERVARAIGQCLHDCGKFKNLPGDPWTDGPSLLAARAAVKAMRVPTLEMLQDGRDAYLRTHRGGVSGMTIEAQIRNECIREGAAYRAMIDAILPATEKGEG